jgi:hypothetical protein
MDIERHEPSPQLRTVLLGPIEGWAQTNGARARLREVPFPGVPLVFGLETAWRIEGPVAVEEEESFVAGLHAAPTFVQPRATSWSCIELRLTPVAAHRILGIAMHELTNRTVALGDVLPETRELTERLRDASSWPDRYTLVEQFLLRRLAESRPSAREVEWSWHQLRRTAGSAPIAELADDIGWSHRRLIVRFSRAGGPRTEGRGTGDAVRPRGASAARARMRARGSGVRLRLLRPGAHEPGLPRAQRHDADSVPCVAARSGRRRRLAAVNSVQDIRGELA